jgi:pimeloyl-ACP methyl ester carboxylesterase
MLSLLDTRFTPEYLAGHPADQALVSMLAARGAVAKSAERSRGEHEQVLARRTHDVMDRLPKITCPTLAAAGRYDGIAPLTNSEAIVRQIPGSELRVYEGGHAFFFQDNRAMAEVLDFLDRP